MKFHKNLTQERWNTFTKNQQILNIASELVRAKNWMQKKNKNYTQNSMDRGLELIDLTVDDKKWHSNSLKELLRFREALAEFYTNRNKILDEIILLIRNLLRFTKESAIVKI